MKKLLAFLILTLLYLPKGWSQEDVDFEQYKRRFLFVPAVGAGVGFSKFTGDIADKGKSNVHFLGNRFGYEAAVSGNISNSFYVNLNAIIGRLSGNENSHGSHRNFESSMVNVGINLEYNFGGLYKKSRPFLTPFLSAGIYYGTYKSFTDLYDENGKLYYYWSDGKIRDVAETAPDADNAQRLIRDYNYETDVTTKSAFSAPVGGGLDFHIGKRFVFRLQSKYFFSFSDQLDGFDTKPSSKNNDGFFYNSVCVFFNLVPDKSNYLPKEFLRELDSEDYDSDAVPDVDDECGGTPLAVAVDKKGCPLDIDTDGIPDYLDYEPNSPTTAVGTDGVLFDYLKIAQNAADSISILHALLDKYPNLFLKSNNLKFTVHVGTFDKTNYRQRLFLQSIPGVKETQVNDSLFVYSVGNYADFNAAEQKKNELQKQGVEHAFEVPGDQLTDVASELDKMLRDTLETPEERKVRMDKALKEEKEAQELAAKGGPYVAIPVMHSEEKKVIAENTEATVVQPVSGNIVVEAAEPRTKEAVAVMSEEKKPEKVVTEQKAVVEEKKVEAVAAVEKEEKKQKDVVKFKVDIIEYPDKALPFSVLMIMQREGVEVQNSRSMNAKVYTIGNYDSLKEAEKLKAEIAGAGVTDITIIGNVNSAKVSQKEAEDALKKATE